MTQKRKEPIKKKVLDLEEGLKAELADVAARVGESANTIVRLCLRAGLNQIKRDNYALLKGDGEHRAEIKREIATGDDTMTLGTQEEFKPRGSAKGTESKRAGRKGDSSASAAA